MDFSTFGSIREIQCRLTSTQTHAWTRGLDSDIEWNQQESLVKAAGGRENRGGQLVRISWLGAVSERASMLTVYLLSVSLSGINRRKRVVKTKWEMMTISRGYSYFLRACMMDMAIGRMWEPEGGQKGKRWGRGDWKSINATETRFGNVARRCSNVQLFCMSCSQRVSESWLIWSLKVKMHRALKGDGAGGGVTSKSNSEQCYDRLTSSPNVHPGLGEF